MTPVPAEIACLTGRWLADTSPSAAIAHPGSLYSSLSFPDRALLRLYLAWSTPGSMARATVGRSLACTAAVHAPPTAHPATGDQPDPVPLLPLSFLLKSARRHTGGARCNASKVEPINHSGHLCLPALVTRHSGLRPWLHLLLLSPYSSLQSPLLLTSLPHMPSSSLIS